MHTYVTLAYFRGNLLWLGVVDVGAASSAASSISMKVSLDCGSPTGLPSRGVITSICIWCAQCREVFVKIFTLWQMEGCDISKAESSVTSGWWSSYSSSSKNFCFDGLPSWIFAVLTIYRGRTIDRLGFAAFVQLMQIWWQTVDDGFTSFMNSRSLK